MSSSATSASRVKLIGFTEVYRSGSGEPSVDIVFVHGLNGHPYKTWAINEVFWPSDLLPDVLRAVKARILTYGYNANVASFTNEISKDRLLSHAETMASHLAANRNLYGLTDRPIIFVCHSLGGILVKRMLIYCRNVSSEKLEHLRSIFVSTYGIIFLGTPHNGSEAAKWGLMLQNICSAVLPRKIMETSGELVKALQTNNETLQNINSLFAEMIGRFHIFFLHETRTTDIKGIRELIVDESSAAPYLEGVERSGIDADHCHICKFEDQNAPGYEVVADALVRYSRNAPHVISDRWIEENRTRSIAREAKAKELISNKENINPSTSLHTFYPTDYPVNHLVLRGWEPPKPGLYNDIPSASTSEPPFVVPMGFHPNASFFGMTREMDILHTRLFKAKKRAERLMAVLICGGPGSGKTHLAREYVWSQRECYPGGIFWVDAKSFSSMHQGFWNIGLAAEATGGIVLPSADSTDSKDSKDPAFLGAVRDWLARREDWLLVFDGLSFNNEKEIDRMKSLLPYNKRCSIIYTSVDQTLRRKQRLYDPYCLQVHPLTVDDACKLLFKDLGIRSPSKDESCKGAELVKHYQCLPLAIHAISHRLGAMSKPIEKYQIDSHLTDERLAEPFWGIMSDLINNRQYEALNLIKILCFLRHQVPVGLVSLGRSALEKMNVQILTSNGPGEEPDIDTTLGTLLRYGLIERTSGEMHPRTFSHVSENDKVLATKAVIPDPSEFQTDNDSVFSLYEGSSKDVIRIHSAVQGFFRDEMKIKDEELKNQPETGPDAPKLEGYYTSWLFVATQVFVESFAKARKKLESKRGYNLVKEYREYETQATRLSENYPKRLEPEFVRKAHSELNKRMKKISEEIKRLSSRLPEKPVEVPSRELSVFDESSPSSSPSPSSSSSEGGSPPQSIREDMVPAAAGVVESPKEMPPEEMPSKEMPSEEIPSEEMPSEEMPSKEMPVAPPRLNLSHFRPRIFRGPSSNKEGHKSAGDNPDAATQTSPALSHASQVTERSKSGETTQPGDDEDWQIVEKLQKTRPGKERQPKARPGFPRDIQSPGLAAPVLALNPAQGRSASASSVGRSPVSATAALTAVQNAPKEEFKLMHTQHGSGDTENDHTWAAVASSRTGEASFPTITQPGLLGTQAARGVSSFGSYDTREMQMDRMSRSAYSDASQEFSAQQLDPHNVPGSRDNPHHLSAAPSMAAAPLEDTTNRPSAIPPRRPPPIMTANHSNQRPSSSRMQGVSPGPSTMAGAVGYGGYISDPPSAMERQSRVSSRQSSYHGWTTDPVTNEPRYHQRPPPMGAGIQTQTLSTGGGSTGEQHRMGNAQEAEMDTNAAGATGAAAGQGRMGPPSNPSQSRHPRRACICGAFPSSQEAPFSPRWQTPRNMWDARTQTEGIIGVVEPQPTPHFQFQPIDHPNPFQTPNYTPYPPYLYPSFYHNPNPIPTRRTPNHLTVPGPADSHGWGEPRWHGPPNPNSHPGPWSNMRY